MDVGQQTVKSKGYLDLISPISAGVGGFFGAWIGGLVFALLFGVPKGVTDPTVIALLYSMTALFSGLLAAGLCPCNHRTSFRISLGRIGAFIGGLFGTIGGSVPPVAFYLGAYASLVVPIASSWLFHAAIPRLIRAE